MVKKDGHGIITLKMNVYVENTVVLIIKVRFCAHGEIFGNISVHGCVLSFLEKLRKAEDCISVTVFLFL